jgi:hypothetical protein
MGTHGVYEPESHNHYTHAGFKNQFNPQEHKIYDKHEAMKNTLKHNHWGPWE